MECVKNILVAEIVMPQILAPLSQGARAEFTATFCFQLWLDTIFSSDYDRIFAALYNAGNAGHDPGILERRIFICERGVHDD
jgi:hypothetical protein